MSDNDWGNDPLQKTSGAKAVSDDDWGNDPLVTKYSQFMKGQFDVPRRTALQGVGQGALDPIYGGAQIGARMGGREEGDLLTPQADIVQRQAVVDKAVREREARIQASRPIEYAPLTYQQREQERQGIHPVRTPVAPGFDWTRFAGNVGATLPLSALGPSAAAGTIPRILASAGSGALAASLNPVTQGDFATEKAKQVGFGALGGAASPVVGSVAGKLISAGERAAPNAAAVAARDAGYVLPPAMFERSGPGINALSGWGGKIKLQQSASVRNQAVTNRLATKALGLPEDTTLTEETFNAVRRQASGAYKSVSDNLPQTVADADFKSTVASIGGRSSQAAQHFPGLMKNEEISNLVDELSKAESFPTQAGIDLVRSLRADAVANLKAIGAPKQHALGLAQRQAADAIDGLIERNLAKIGKEDLATNYRAARQLIAKSHDIEGATNSATGDVSARGLARLADNGRPLTGELDTIARSATAFPKAFQNPSTFGGDEPLSALDFFGSALSIAHGRPEIAGAILARPIARHAALSDYIQNRLATLPKPPIAAPARNYLAQALQQGSPFFAPQAGLAAGAMFAPQGVNRLARMMQMQGRYPQQQPILPMPGQQQNGNGSMIPGIQTTLPGR